MNKGKRWVAAVFYLVLASVLVGIGVWQVGKGPERLSEERIAELLTLWHPVPGTPISGRQWSGWGLPFMRRWWREGRRRGR